MNAVRVSLELQKKREGRFDYEIQVLRVGELALVGLPGEPFVEGQLAIKMDSPTRWTYVCHDVTQYVGYLPIREGYARGGHEAAPSYWSKFAPGALETVVEEATTLLTEVFARS